jgi:hypothetical protein
MVLSLDDCGFNFTKPHAFCSSFNHGVLCFFSLRKVGEGEEGDGVKLKPFRFRV